MNIEEQQGSLFNIVSSLGESERERETSSLGTNVVKVRGGGRIRPIPTQAEFVTNQATHWALLLQVYNMYNTLKHPFVFGFITLTSLKLHFFS